MTSDTTTKPNFFLRYWGLTLLLAVVLIGALTIFPSYIGAYNTGNEQENDIIAAYDHNRNTLSQATAKVMEVAQIPARYRDDLIKVIEAQLKARYGQDGSKVIAFMQENNLPYDPSMQRRVAQLMETRRDDFANSQDELIYKKTGYKKMLGSFWDGFWLRRAGYPKIDLNKYNILVEADTEADFQSGTTRPLKLPPN